MRVVFLDFDGVIATASTYKVAYTVRVPTAWGESETHWPRPYELIDPRLVANVQKLCTEAEAAVVLSTSWRESHPLADLTLWLRNAGLTAEVLGTTPVFPGEPRGKEIVAWMESNGRTAPDVVILEDDEDVAPLRGRQIRTAFGGPRQGFTDRHLRRALRLWGLGEPGRRLRRKIQSGVEPA